MIKKFWIHIDMNNYRSGKNIYTFIKGPESEESSFEDEDIENAPEEAVCYSFSIPEKYRIYIVSEFPNYKIIGHIDTKNKDFCKKLYLKMYSQIYNCLPFQITGYNSAYKEEGYYPEIPEDIKNIPNINIINKLNHNEYNIYFVFAIDKDGNEVLCEIL